MSDTEHAKRRSFAGVADRLAAKLPASLKVRGDAAFTGLIVVAFLFIGAAGILHHEMWRDELQAWLIARDSASLGDLFYNLRYEKHPGLWHLCLYFISRFTTNPLAMQLFHLGIAAGVVYLFAKFSPFTKLQKLLFTFGYFPFYEYAIISRCYALGLLLTFIYCALYSKHRKNYLALLCVLALLANTSVYGLILAVAFGLALLLRVVLNDHPSNSQPGKRWSLAGGAAIFILSVAASLIQIIPPPQGAIESEQNTLANVFDKRLAVTSRNKDRAVRALTKVWESYAPVPKVSSPNFWNTNILMVFPNHVQRRLSLGLSLLLLATATIIFARRPVVCSLYLAGNVGLLLFIYSVYPGYIRHHGHLFILLISCLWISETELQSNWIGLGITRASDVLNTYRSKIVTTLLGVHLAAGVFAVTKEFREPFSTSRKAAAFIRQFGAGDVLIVGSPDNTTNFIPGYLGGEIYYLEKSDFGSFTVWSKYRKEVSPEEAIGKVSALIEAQNKDVLFVSNYALDSITPLLDIAELASFTGSVVEDENFYVYLIRKKPLFK